MPDGGYDPDLGPPPAAGVDPDLGPPPVVSRARPAFVPDTARPEPVAGPVTPGNENPWEVGFKELQRIRAAGQDTQFEAQVARIQHEQRDVIRMAQRKRAVIGAGALGMADEDRLMRKIIAGDASLAGKPRPDEVVMEAFTRPLPDSTVGERMLDTGIRTVAELPAYVLGGAALKGAGVGAGYVAPILMGTQGGAKAYAHGEDFGGIAKAVATNALFATLAHGLDAAYGGMWNAVTPEVKGGILREMATGGMSMMTAGAIINGPNPENALQDYLLGAVFKIGGGGERTRKPFGGAPPGEPAGAPPEGPAPQVPSEPPTVVGGAPRPPRQAAEAPGVPFEHPLPNGRKVSVDTVANPDGTFSVRGVNIHAADGTVSTKQFRPGEGGKFDSHEAARAAVFARARPSVKAAGEPTFTYDEPPTGAPPGEPPADDAAARVARQRAREGTPPPPPPPVETPGDRIRKMREEIARAQAAKAAAPVHEGEVPDPVENAPLPEPRTTPPSPPHPAGGLLNESDVAAWESSRRGEGDSAEALPAVEPGKQVGPFVVESDRSVTKRRIHGMNTLVEVDPAAFKARYEADNGEALPWDAGRADLATRRPNVDEPPFVGLTDGGGLAVDNGRHRINEAARRGVPTMTVAVSSPKEAEALKARLSKPVGEGRPSWFDEPPAPAADPWAMTTERLKEMAGRADEARNLGYRIEPKKNYVRFHQENANGEMVPIPGKKGEIKDQYVGTTPDGWQVFEDASNKGHYMKRRAGVDPEGGFSVGLEYGGSPTDEEMDRIFHIRAHDLAAKEFRQSRPGKKGQRGMALLPDWLMEWAMRGPGGPVDPKALDNEMRDLHGVSPLKDRPYEEVLQDRPMAQGLAQAAMASLKGRRGMPAGGATPPPPTGGKPPIPPPPPPPYVIPPRGLAVQGPPMIPPTGGPRPVPMGPPRPIPVSGIERTPVIFNWLASMQQRVRNEGTAAAIETADLAKKISETTREYVGEMSPQLDAALAKSSKSALDPRGRGALLGATATSLATPERVPGKNYFTSRFEDLTEGRVAPQNPQEQALLRVHSDFVKKIGEMSERIGVKVWNNTTGSYDDFQVKPGLISPRISSPAMHEMLMQGPRSKYWQPTIEAIADLNGLHYNVVESDFLGRHAEATNTRNREGHQRQQQMEMHRAYPRVPSAVIVGGKTVPIFESNPSTYFRRLAETRASRLAVITEAGQDIPQTGQTRGYISDLRERYSQQGGDDRLFTQLFRGLHNQAVNIPVLKQGSKAQRLATGFQHAMSAAKVLSLSGSGVTNIPEMLGTITAFSGPRLAAKTAMQVLGAKGAEMLNRPNATRTRIGAEWLKGSVTKETKDWSYDPSQKTRSGLRIANELGKSLTGHGALNEMQESLGALVTREIVDKILKPGLGTEVHVRRLMGMGVPEAEARRMAKGQASQAEYDALVARNPGRMVSANLNPTEMSSAEHNRAVKTLTAFQRYGMMSMRTTGTQAMTAYRGLRDAMRGSDNAGTVLSGGERWSRAGNSLRALLEFTAGKAAQGTVLHLLSGLAMGGVLGLKTAWHEMKDDPLGTIGKNTAGAAFGGLPYFLYSAQTGQRNPEDILYPVAIAKTILGLFTDSGGRWTGGAAMRDKNFSERLVEVAKRLAPAYRISLTGLAAVGIGAQGSQIETATKAFYRWRQDQPNKGHFTPGDNKTEEDLAFRASIRRAADAVINNENPDKVQSELMTALGVRGEKGKPVREAILARKILTKESLKPDTPANKNAISWAAALGERKASLKARIGEDAYHQLELHDELLDTLARAYQGGP